jgi:hypothetical protein
MCGVNLASPWPATTSLTWKGRAIGCNVQHIGDFQLAQWEFIGTPPCLTTLPVIDSCIRRRRDY